MIFELLIKGFFKSKQIQCFIKDLEKKRAIKDTTDFIVVFLVMWITNIEKCDCKR